MRDILFRGKRIDNGEWVYGSLWINIDEVYILSAANCVGIEVDPKTVGQYTGLTDKNGKKIFEGDIVKCPFSGKKLHLFSICYVDGEFLAVPAKDDKNLWAFRISGENQNMMVIGNIHDNPELLEGEENAAD